MNRRIALTAGAFLVTALGAPPTASAARQPALTLITGHTRHILRADPGCTTDASPEAAPCEPVGARPINVSPGRSVHVLANFPARSVKLRLVLHGVAQGRPLTLKRVGHGWTYTIPTKLEDRTIALELRFSTTTPNARQWLVGLAIAHV